MNTTKFVHALDSPTVRSTMDKLSCGSRRLRELLHDILINLRYSKLDPYARFTLDGETTPTGKHTFEAYILIQLEALLDLMLFNDMLFAITTIDDLARLEGESQKTVLAPTDEKTAGSLSVPAPRLVGIEPNPGPPPKKDAIRTAIEGAAAALVQKISTTKKKKNKPSQTKVKETSLTYNMTPVTRRVMKAPVSYGVTRSGVRTATGSVPFSGPMWSVVTDSASPPHIYLTLLGGAAGASGGSWSFGLIPVSSATTGIYSQCFPYYLQAIFRGFAEYRIKPGTLKVWYEGLVPTTTGGQISVALYNGDYPNTSQVDFGSNSMTSNSITGPFWSPRLEVNIMDRQSLEVGTGNGWKYNDSDGTILQPEARQDVAFCVGVQGLGIPSSTVLGTICMSAVFELRGVSNATFVTALPLGRPPLIRQTGCDFSSTSSASSSSSIPPVSNIDSHTESLESSIHISHADADIIRQSLKKLAL